jgi:hypothetical protein
MSEDRFLTAREILCIPEKDLPLIVLSRNYYSHFATEIGQTTKSLWNHFMWMIHPGKFATQDWIFHEVPVVDYLDGSYNLKFWTCSIWNSVRRLLLIRTIEDYLKLPWYRRQYDVLQILGIKLHIRKLQLPFWKICSDWADEIGVVDPRFIGHHMTPGEVNEWCKKTGDYVVYGKHVPND